MALMDLTGTPLGRLPGIQYIEAALPRCSYVGYATGVTAAAAATDIFELVGSATKLVRVHRLEIAFSATTAAQQTAFIVRRSTAATGGTAVAMPLNKIDSDANCPAATAVARHFTANPTPGTNVATLRGARAAAYAGTAPTVDRLVMIGPDDMAMRPFTLRGASDYLCINLNAAILTGLAFDISIWISEE